MMGRRGGKKQLKLRSDAGTAGGDDGAVVFS